MARKPTIPAALPESASLPAQELTIAQRAASAATDDVLKWFEAAEASSAIRFAELSATVAEKSMVEIYIRVRESKSYAGMPYRTADGKVATIATLDEFCEAKLGKSARRCRELASNYEMLGAELYEQAEALGLRQRDYNALKALPADDQVVVKQALEDGADKATVIETLVSLVERQSAEKAKLVQQADDARADNDTLQERNAKLIEQVEKAQQKAATAARKWRAASVDERRAELERNVQEAALAVRAAIAREGAEPGVGLHGAVIMLMEHADSNGQDVRGFLANIYAQLIEEVQLSRDDEDWPVAIPMRGSAEG